MSAGASPRGLTLADNKNMPNIADIMAEARELVDADSTKYPDVSLLRRINAAYEEIAGDLIALDKSWKFDDSRYTDLPIGVGSLVSGQRSYAFNSSLLTIDRVEVIDKDGNTYKLEPILEDELGALDEFEKTNGIPKYYSKKYNSIFIYPAASSAKFNFSNDLLIHYRRTASVFTAGDISAGTAEPGFASPYHYLLSYKAALPFAISYKKDRVPLILNEINRMREGLIALASVRDGDKIPRMVPRMNESK